MRKVHEHTSSGEMAFKLMKEAGPGLSWISPERRSRNTRTHFHDLTGRKLIILGNKNIHINTHAHTYMYMCTKFYKNNLIEQCIYLFICVKEYIKSITHTAYNIIYNIYYKIFTFFMPMKYIKLDSIYKYKINKMNVIKTEMKLKQK